MNAASDPAVSSSRYGLLASAIAGRRVAVQAGPGSLSSCDGQTIFLSVIESGGERMTLASVVAQAALIGAGSLNVEHIRRLVGRREAAQRYAYLEVLRAAKLLAGRLPNVFLELPEISGMHATTCSPAESLDWALSARSLPLAPSYFGCVRPLAVLRKAVSDEGLGALTSKQAAGKLAQQRIEAFDDDEDTEESKILKLLQNPLMGSNAISDVLNRILGVGASRGHREKISAGDGGAEIPVGRVERAIRRGLHAMLSKLPIHPPDFETPVESADFIYSEWDVHAHKYKSRWVVVEEVEAWRPDGARNLDAVLKPAPVELRRQLGSLGLDHEMHRHQVEGAEFDLGRLLDCAIDFATGHTPSSLDVYRGSRRTRRDLAIAVVLDISGSTGEKNNAGEAVFDQQLQVAYQLARTLDQLGDTVAVFGFHSWGRGLVRAVRLKGAEERWSARIAQRFAQLEPVGYTRTGAAIRHGARLLTTRMRLPNRLLVLITDGVAYDQDYESTYAAGDTRKALEEVRAAGVAVVCLCVGGSRDAESLRSVFGVANLLIVDQAMQITARIRPICLQALAAVSQRKLKTERHSGERSSG